MSSRERQSRRFYRVESQHDLLAHMDKGEMAYSENRWTLEIAQEAANKGTLPQQFEYILFLPIQCILTFDVFTNLTPSNPD